MKLPTRFRLKGKTWTISYVDQLINFGGQKCRGLCDFNTKEIIIHRKQSYKKLCSTLFHEYLHAIAFSYDVKLTHQTIYELEEPLAKFVMEQLL